MKDSHIPAFPVSDTQSACPKTIYEQRDMARGMTLRDYFAAKAMQGLLNNAYANATCEGDNACLAHESYRIADAMLAERSKQ